MLWTDCIKLACRGIVFGVAVCAAVSGAVAAPADKQASFVIDGNSGEVLHSQNADEPRYPASLTKMMTLYVAFGEIAAGRMTANTMLTISVPCAGMAPSKIGLKVGERISLGNAMKAVVTKSANDMACAIAEAISGSEPAFARRMTKTARSIGMTATTFRNASGLPDPRQLTTARDMGTLGLRLRDDFPQQFSIFQLRSFSYGGKTYKSHNTLMRGFAGMDGIKTGYTRASGFNLVSSVRRDGKYVVGAVFGGVSASVRNAHMRVILFHALAKASTQRTRKSGPVLVAKARQAKPPPKPQVVGKAAPQQAPAKPVKAAPAARQAEVTQDPTIKIAKVKAVMVAGANAGASTAAPAKAAPTEKPRERPQFVTASATPRLDLNRNQAAAFGAPASTSSPSEPVRRPGTLNAQSAKLARSAANDAPAAKVAMPATGGYLIQVGSFGSAAEASRCLDDVRDKAGKLLQGRPSRTEQAQVGKRQVFRARFAQFDSAGATAACATLRQQKVDCLVLKGQ